MRRLVNILAESAKNYYKCACPLCKDELVFTDSDVKNSNIKCAGCGHIFTIYDVDITRVDRNGKEI